ncbi:hypothetical protein PENPOL_c008G09281 [Penicillium polonicum]|uniref:Uncharacterized protein n=1 Tax=Penicillium polonicum TaxID=60169 RepID=A0A1V6NHG4_PENPO|nr:hypothetical protein PENPOL_c008G09281 [Penicillium polonicum]
MPHKIQPRSLVPDQTSNLTSNLKQRELNAKSNLQLASNKLYRQPRAKFQQPSDRHQPPPLLASTPYHPRHFEQRSQQQKSWMPNPQRQAPSLTRTSTWDPKPRVPVRGLHPMSTATVAGLSDAF